MVKEKFKEWNPKQESIDKVNLCNRIIRDYSAQGYTLTLRQLYYQLVTKNAIANHEKEYRKLSSLVSNARLAGLIDWDAIEDRVRVPWTPPEYDDLDQLVDAATRSYRLPRLMGQSTYPELWVEKDALAGVLRPLASKYHSVLMVNRGYSSQSAMHDSALRVISEKERIDAEYAVIFYLGDLDPSGEDMVDDIRNRFNIFNCPVDVEKIALTIDQVQTHQPPPNPTKMTDSRAAKYVAKFGYESWEVDALPPQTLQTIIDDAFESVLDLDIMEDIKLQEQKDKLSLEEAVAEIMEGQDG